MYLFSSTQLCMPKLYTYMTFNIVKNVSGPHGENEKGDCSGCGNPMPFPGVLGARRSTIS